MSNLPRYEIDWVYQEKDEKGGFLIYSDVETQIQAYIASLEADRAALYTEIADKGTPFSVSHVKAKIAGLTLAIDKAKVMLG